MKKRNLWKKSMALLLAGMMVLGMTACGDTDKGAGTAAEGKELREINVVLDWYPNAVHEFIYIAAEKGYFAEEGLKVNIQFPSNTNDALSLVAAGQAELGMYYPHDVVQARLEQNVPVKAIGSICQTPLNIILSLKTAGIHSPSDLVGKKIGYAGTELSEAMVSSLMQSVGADSSSVEMVDVGFDLMTSMTTGNVDATIGCMLNHEVPQMEEEGFPVSYFTLPEYGISNYPELVFVTNDTCLEKDQEMLAGFLRACKKGFADMKADPKAAVDLLLANQNEENFPLSETVETQSTKILLESMEANGHAFLESDKGDWEALIGWMADNKLISEACSVDEVVAEIKAE